MYNSTDEIIRELGSILRQEPSKLVPFVGAGASLDLGLPDWEDLTENYYKEVEDDIHDVKFEDLKKQHDKDWPKIVQDIYNLSGRNNNTYFRFLSRFNVSKTGYKRLHFQLIKHFDHILTTNYDRAFDSVIKDLGNKEFKKLYFPESLNPINFIPCSIAYLHGHVDKKSFVFREYEYKVAYEDTTYIEDFLKSILKSKSLIFIGFSFDDVRFKDCISKVINDEKNFKEIIKETFNVSGAYLQSNEHYILIKENEFNHISEKDLIDKYSIDKNMVVEYFNIEEIEGKSIIVLKNDTNPNDAKSYYISNNQKGFFEDYMRIHKSIEKILFLKKLDFKFIRFGDRYVELEDIIDKITDSNIDVDDQLPSSV